MLTFIDISNLANIMIVASDHRLIRLTFSVLLFTKEMCHLNSNLVVLPLSLQMSNIYDMAGEFKDAFLNSISYLFTSKILWCIHFKN